MSSRVAFGIRVVVLGVLAWAVLATLVYVYEFGQQRFFTIDEYQYGHATWLVANGERPYLDFYEHHFPLSYVFHALFADDSGSFAERALAFRTIAFAYLFAMAVALWASAIRVTRDPMLAALTACLPLAFGFGLMSSIEYRADNFAACLFVMCLAGLEANRARPRAAFAVVCGLVFAASVFMTQKMLFVGGGALAAMLGWDLLVRRRAGGAGTPCIAHPLAFFGAAAVFAAVAVAIAAALGMLPAAFETTILHTLEHEAYYPHVRFWKYAAPFFAETRISTSLILAFAAYYVFFCRDPLWTLALVIAIASGAMMQTQYPYNFVYTGFLVMICAVRGFVAATRRVWPVSAAMSGLRPILYLLPLAVLPDQLAFVANTTNNAHQTALLTKLETYSDAADAVIDGAGGALFRKHGSYYWYHGSAHRRMFRSYFETELLRDYRDSGALFWIHDVRQRKLPKIVREYFADHYVRVDGDLHTLGFRTEATAAAGRSREVDVLRAGDYLVHQVSVTKRGELVRAIHPGDATGLAIDGQAVRGGRVRLEAGRHTVTVAPDSSAYVVSLLPAEAFERTIPPRRTHSPLFEFDPKFRRPRPGVVRMRGIPSSGVARPAAQVPNAATSVATKAPNQP